MCGRYVTPAEAAIERLYKLTAAQATIALAKTLGDLEKERYNVAPTQDVPIIRIVRERDGVREVLPMRWGLIPFFARGVPGQYSTINARVETIATSPAYRGPWKRGQRCIFPAKGFYEWHLNADGTKQPYYVHPADDDDVFSLAGIWDSSVTADGEIILSCAIVTMPANELMAEVHNDKQRMPLILARDDVDTWLSGSAEQAMALVKPFPADRMRAHPVSKRVNKPANQGPELILPLGSRDGTTG